MEKVCVRCREMKKIDAVEVTIKIHGLTYSTQVAARTCRACRGKHIDPNELAAFKTGMAMRFVERGRLTGRSFAYCRKVLRLGSTYLAQHLNISNECLLALEDKEIFVPAAMHDDMARRVRRTFKALAFVPRFALEEEPTSSVRMMDI